MTGRWDLRKAYAELLVLRGVQRRASEMRVRQAGQQLDRTLLERRRAEAALNRCWDQWDEARVSRPLSLDLLQAAAHAAIGASETLDQQRALEAEVEARLSAAQVQAAHTVAQEAQADALHQVAVNRERRGREAVALAQIEDLVAGRRRGLR